MIPRTKTDRDYPPRTLARRMAVNRVGALTSGTCFADPQEWNLEFEQLKAAVHQVRADQFSELRKIDHHLVHEEIAAEAGFLLGLELGKRLGGAR
jgi:hypothetical protein